MKDKALAVSIVIPVYNEEHHLKATLDALKKQTVKPLEVLVVDNNSSDGSVALAKKYSFVRVLHEKKQGLPYARNTGYDAAKGEIIAKLDADSIASPNWVERLQKNFADPTVMGVTGDAYTNVIPRVRGLYVRWISKAYFAGVHMIYGVITMWGANMAIRKTVWNNVKDRVCNDDQIVHEDVDVSLLIAGDGGKIVRDGRLMIRTRKQSYHYFPKLVHFMRLGGSTKQHHREIGTYSSPKLHRLSFVAKILGIFCFVCIGMPYFAVSFLLWPFDNYKIKHQDPKHPWLD